MMKVFFSVALVLCFVEAHSQSSDKIEMHRTFFNTKFYHNNAELTKPAQVLKLMEQNPEAFKEFKKAKANYNASIVFGGIGGALIGWPLGTALGGKILNGDWPQEELS
jgi:hypothetical protein